MRRSDTRALEDLLQGHSAIRPLPAGPHGFLGGAGSVRTVIVLAMALGGAAFALAAAAAEITELPPGPDRDLVAKVCQSCHDLQMVFDAAGISRQEWDMSLEEMTANGMNISADDRSKILAYLSTYLGPSPPKPTIAH